MNPLPAPVEVGNRRAEFDAKANAWSVSYKGKLVPSYGFGCKLDSAAVRKLLERLHESDLMLAKRSRELEPIPTRSPSLKPLSRLFWRRCA